ncbi:MAG: hypothetical protein K6F95_01295 [Selenomonas sp.]|uniref:hypothetical protein n=1 Tax=Selenomonas sp. TaxID=2053611 RepID=UPI0025F7D134|nr:hypothetical protein [Selenomonas sp.]MCR5756528.1 hypothetical protein [Selenomonas sp.]
MAGEIKQDKQQTTVGKAAAVESPYIFSALTHEKRAVCIAVIHKKQQKIKGLFPFPANYHSIGRM